MHARGSGVSVSGLSAVDGWRSGRRAVCRALVPVIVAVAVLAGCSGDGGDVVLDPTPTATATATDEPTTPKPSGDPTPSTDPTEALEAEITAFFKEYIQAVNQSWTSKKALERRRQMFTDSCDACLAGYEFAERTHSENLEFDGDEAVVRDVQVTSTSDDVIVFMTVTDFPSGRLLNPDGSAVMTFDATIGRQTVYQASRTDTGRLIIVASDTL